MCSIMFELSNVKRGEIKREEKHNLDQVQGFWLAKLASAGLNSKESCSIFVSVAKNRAKQCCRSSFDQSELESHGLGNGDPPQRKLLLPGSVLCFHQGSHCGLQC